MKRLIQPNGTWGTGKLIDAAGYVRIRIICTKYGKNFHYVFEHRHVMEKKLRRPLLSNEEVHHINSIKTDNRPENLILLDKKHHLILEHVNGLYKEHYKKLHEQNKKYVGCKEKNCKKKHLSKGYCEAHYSKFIEYPKRKKYYQERYSRIKQKS